MNQNHSKIVTEKKIYLCTKDEIYKNKHLIFWIEEFRDELIVFVNKLNQIKVFSSICPHFGGEIKFNHKDNTLTCKWHNWKFCPNTGTCLTYKIIGRLKSYDFQIEPGSLKNYTTKIENNKIYALLVEN
tara:strand:+ start:301 stop:687 length:387 start_codon:yes stop_codon:yes gene_type:complete